MGHWVDLRKLQLSVYWISFDIPKECEFLGKIKTLSLDLTLFYVEMIRYLNEIDNVNIINFSRFFFYFI